MLNTGELLWTSKSRSANEACLGLLDARFRLRPHYFRNPIINQLYRGRPAGVGFEHDVGWLDVAMHYAARFRGSQCARGLLNYFQGECERHWPITAHTGFQGFAFDQFHGVETLAILLSVIGHPGNVWMMNVRSCARFAQKTRPRAQILRHSALDDLESSFRVQDCIAGAISYGHCPRAELDRKTIRTHFHLEVCISQWSGR